MHAVSRRSLLVLSSALLIVVIPVAARQELGQAPVTPKRDASLSVLRLEPGATASTALDKGATYHGLESQLTRVTTTFVDAVAVNERDADGAIVTRLTDRAGNQLATFRVDRPVGKNDQIEFQAMGDPVVRTAARAELKPTLDWAGRQAYTFFHDRVAATTGPVEWERNLVRPAKRRLRDLDRRIVEVRSEWPDGVTVTARRPASRAAATAAPGDAVISFTATMEKDGVELGWVRWHQNRQVLAWKFPAGTSGYMSPKRLAEIGGWPFAPDMAWANVQAFAFYELPKRQPPPQWLPAPKPGLFGKVLEAVMPTLHAQDGCTGLHWLDGTTFRQCCDQHDRCYNTAGCGRYSWYWPWAQYWQCGACNVGAVYCFISTAGSGDGTPYI